MSDDITGMAVVPRWLQRDPNVSWQAKLVYLAINSRVGEHGAAFPSHATIAEDCGIGVTSVKKGIAELEKLGVLTKVNRFQDGGGQTSNEYALAIHRPPVATRPPSPHDDPPSRVATTPQSPRGDEGFKPKDSSLKDSNSLSLPSRDKQLAEEFDDFWNVYPIRQAKAAAQKAWLKARRRAEYMEIMRGAAAYRDDPNRADGYTAYPATWLNADRWTDGPLPSKDKPATVTSAPPLNDRTAEHLNLVAYYDQQEAANQLPGIEA